MAGPTPDEEPDDAEVDEMSMNSFPASDPPAVWTWEPREAGDRGDAEDAPASTPASKPG